jgi:hypothetical protein
MCNHLHCRKNSTLSLSLKTVVMQFLSRFVVFLHVLSLVESSRVAILLCVFVPSSSIYYFTFSGKVMKVPISSLPGLICIRFCRQASKSSNDFDLDGNVDVSPGVLGDLFTNCFKPEICSLLGNYTASCGNYLPTFRDNVSVPSSRVKIPSRIIVGVLMAILVLEANSYTDPLYPSLLHRPKLGFAIRQIA